MASSPLLPDILDPGDPDPAVRERVRLWLALQRLTVFQPQRVAAALAAGADPRAWLGVAPLPPEVEQARAGLARLGARLVPLPSPAYPARLRRLSDAPPLLAVCGRVETLATRCVAIVGARAPSAYGREVAFRLAAGLARAGLCVVSGLARGIDACAHRGALDAGGATLAFLGCGPDRVYPAGHRALAGRIAGAGAVVSEFPSGTPPRAPHFPLRNRLISGLSEAVVVVEARERSGSLVTARHAADQGVDVLAVPGPVDGPTHAGPHRLIRDGAGLVTGAGDVLEALGLPRESAEGGAFPAWGAAPALARDPLARAALALLRDAPRGRDALARALGARPAALARALLELELAGAVAEDRDGRLRPVSPPGSTRL